MHLKHALENKKAVFTTAVGRDNKGILMNVSVMLLGWADDRSLLVSKWQNTYNQYLLDSWTDESTDTVTNRFAGREKQMKYNKYSKYKT